MLVVTNQPSQLAWFSSHPWDKETAEAKGEGEVNDKAADGPAHLLKLKLNQ